MVTSQNGQTPKAKDQVNSPEKITEQRKDRTQPRSITLGSDNQVPVLNLGSLPSPPAPEPADKATSAKERTDVNASSGANKPQ
jgi:hypothetical protein